MAKRRAPIRTRAPNSLAPLRILKQIAILQTVFYLSATLLIVFTVLVAGYTFSAGMVLGSSTSVRGDTALGLTMGLLWLLSGLVVALSTYHELICMCVNNSVLTMTLVLARSKLVLDFALTLHFLHILTTSIYQGGVPREIGWWGLQGLSAVGMVVLGGWACRWRELRPISIAVPGGTSAAEVDAERAEDYEMVPMMGKDGGGGVTGGSGSSGMRS
ncbi:integral membrane protein S linking to the trans Golgi network-domain-containing protein [Terfezia claveryi]|nr:integral membrane protein S linking to the trans Golgi network-domain-containing protein [Terfezia claveryi]